MGVSYYYLQEYSNAEDCFRKSLKLKASYRDAQVWLERVEQAIQEMEHTGATPSSTTTTPIPPAVATSDGNNNENDKENEVVKVDEEKDKEIEQGDVIRQDSNNDVIAVVAVSEK